MQTALVIQTAFLGDAVLGTALLERVHATHPDCRIDYLVRKGNEGLFKGHPFLNEVLLLDKSRKFSELWRLLRVIRSREYDVVMNAQRFASSGLLTAFSGAGVTVGYGSNPFSFLFSAKVPHRLGPGFEGVHELDRLLDLFPSEGPHPDVRPRLYPSLEDERAVEGLLGRLFVTMAPASAWFTKQWPLEKWVGLIRALPANLTIHLIGGPDDVALCQRIASESGDARVSILCGKLSLLQTAALMRHARMNYANDSAPVHIASAVNAPICEVYCSTVPQFGFTPLSDVSYVIQTQEQLKCRPCGLHGHRACPEGHFSCADIPTEQLVAVLGRDEQITPR